MLDRGRSALGTTEVPRDPEGADDDRAGGLDAAIDPSALDGTVTLVRGGADDDAIGAGGEPEVTVIVAAGAGAETGNGPGDGVVVVEVVGPGAADPWALSSAIASPAEVPSLSLIWP